MSRASELADELESLSISRGISRREEILSSPEFHAAEELRRLERVNAELVEAMRRIREACGSTWVNKEWIAFHAGVAIAKAALTSATKEQQK